MPERPWKTIDEMRAEAGLPPETHEQRAGRHARQDAARVESDRRVEAARAEMLRQQEEREAKRREVAEALSAAMRAENMMELLRPIVVLDRSFDLLDSAGRSTVDAKMKELASDSVMGTPEQVTALNALVSKIRQWKRSEAEREAGNARVIPRAELISDSGEKGAPPPRTKKSRDAEPPGIVENFLRLFRKRS